MQAVSRARVETVMGRRHIAHSYSITGSAGVRLSCSVVLEELEVLEGLVLEEDVRRGIEEEELTESARVNTEALSWPL